MRTRTLATPALLGALFLGCYDDSAGGDGTSNGGTSNGGTSNGGTSNGGTSNGGTSNGGTSSGGTFERDASTGTVRPPPTITSVSPLAGDYGTEVTITGTHFDGAKLVLPGGGKPLELTIPSAGVAATPADVVTSWSDTQIKFRYPFPADGAIRVVSTGGQAEGGTFVPTWTPGPSAGGTLTRRTLLGVVSPTANVTVAVFDDLAGPIILTAKADGTISTKAFARGTTALQTMSVFLTSTGTVDGFFASGGKLWRLTDAAGAATTVDTGVSATMAAGGEDASGQYAWIDVGGTLSRVRPPSWTAEATVANPSDSNARSIAVGPDRALYVAWGQGGSSGFPFYDQYAITETKRLQFGQSTFDATSSIGGGVDDVMIWTRLIPGPGGRLAAFYCASDTGIFESPSVDCGQGYSGAGGAAADAVVGWNATKAFAATCDPATAVLSLGPETQTSEQVPILFPCPSTVAVSADPADAAHLLVSVDGLLYAPKKR